MSTSYKMVSTQDKDKFVFVTCNAGWRRTKIYANGSLIRQFKKASEFRNGTEILVNDFGTIQLSLNALGKLEVSVDGIRYEHVVSKKHAIDRFRGAAAVFVILAVLNFLFLLLTIVFLFDTAETFSRGATVLTTIALICTIVYTVSAAYLRKGLTIFYFIGLTLYVFTTFYFLSEFMDHDGEFFLWYGIPRLVFFALILRYIGRVLNYAQNYQDKDDSNVLDSEF